MGFRVYGCVLLLHRFRNPWFFVVVCVFLLLVLSGRRAVSK